MRKLVRGLFLLTIAFLIYLLFYPTGLLLNQWEPPKAPDLIGDLSVNNILSKLELIYEGQCDRCEDIAIDRSGNIYGGEINGNIKFFEKGSQKGKVLANTGGRPLGLHFDPLGDLIIADADKGILKLTMQGDLSILTNSYRDYTFQFADDLEIDSNGVIYFTDASERFGFHENYKNVLENQPSGAFYKFDPKSGETSLLVADMYFANGVAIDHEEDFVLINETTRYQLRKYWLNGPNKGSAQILRDNLPGFPDGISRGADGIFWMTFASPRKKVLDDILPKPFFRNIVARLPSFLQPKPTHYGIILGINDEGDIVHNFQDPDGNFGEITSVQQYGNKLYLGSLYENGIGVFDLDNIN